jgi:uncharacterized protein (TIRG00374 family)
VRAKTVWLGLLLSLVCLGFFVWRAEWRGIGLAFAEIDPLAVAVAAFWILVSLAGRAWRWKFLLGPRRAASFRHRLTTTAIGFMGNSIFPGRLGEPLRCLMLSRLEPRVTFTAALGTIVMERVLDLTATLTALVVFLVCFPLVASADASRADLFQKLRFVGWVFAGGLVVSSAVLLLIARRRERVGAARQQERRHARASRFARLVPEEVGRRAAALLASFADGLESLRSFRALALSLCFTAVVWLAILLNDLFMLRAFGFTDLGLIHALGLMVVLCFAVALPQAPGYVGVFQIASETTLTGLYGVPVARAQAFAIALWACHVVPVVAAGIVAIWVEGLSIADLRSGRTAVRARSRVDHEHA